MPWPVLAGGAGDPAPLVRDIGLCILVAGLLSVVFARLRIPSIAGFIGAGILLGPQVSGLITDQSNIETIANLGLVLLLFLIGLEIDLRRLLRSGRALVVAGIAQFPLCVAFGVAVAFALRGLDFAPLRGKYVPLYVGFAAAASSTLLVVRLLQEKQRMDTVVGRISVGILIFQDMWAIVVLAAQPNFDHPALGPVVATFGGIALLAVVGTLAAKFLLRTAFEWVAQSPELILVTATGWCFGLGLLGNNLGAILAHLGLEVPVQVSLEMGALIAGASIASFPYSTQVVSKVAVVQEFLITLFFVGLGMQIPRPEGVETIVLAGVLVVAGILSRFLVFFPLLYFNGLDRRSSLVCSVKLMPISEFCLVIAYVGMNHGHVSKDFVGSVIFAFVATALLAPVAFAVADRTLEGLAGFLSRIGLRERKHEPGEDEGKGEAPEIVLLGFHRIASSLVHEIGTQHPELKGRTLVLDFNVNLHAAIAARGVRVEYGDIASAETLKHAGVAQARVVVSTIPDDLLIGTSNLKLVRMVRAVNPRAVLVVNAITTASVEELYEAGADFVFLPRVEIAAGLVPVIRSAMETGVEDLRRRYEDRFGPFPKRDEVLP